MDNNYKVGRLFVKDCSLASELIDGVNIYKAVKMSPFTLTLAIDTSTLFYSLHPDEIADPSENILNLSNVTIDVSLIFDHAEEKVKNETKSYIRKVTNVY